MQAGLDRVASCIVVVAVGFENGHHEAARRIALAFTKAQALTPQQGN
jgi:hypothetical protein